MNGVITRNRVALNRTSSRPSSIPVVPGLSLGQYTASELATRLERRDDVEPGVGWARSGARPEKANARTEVVRLFDRTAYPGTVSVLTFPGIGWEFERRLLEKREGGHNIWTHSPECTYICAVEREESIYRASLNNIPRGRKGDAARFIVQPTPPFASASLSTNYIKRYHRCDFEDYAVSNATRAERGRVIFDGAWLDFNGHLSPRRLAAIETFWRRQVKGVLVVTLLNARTAPQITRLIEMCGGIARALQSRLPGSDCIHAIHYGDTTPMVQVALRRVVGEPTGITNVSNPAKSCQT